MQSEITGDATSRAEVLNVSPHGFWLLLAGLFVSYLGVRG